MPVIVSNASPLIILSAIGELRLLKGLFGHVLIAPDVRVEVVDRGRGRAGAAEVAAASFIKVQPIQGAVGQPAKEVIVHLGKGEASTLALALEAGADLVLMDDKQARAAARSLGLKTAGVVRVLELAHERGTLPDVREAYRRLMGLPTRIAPSVLRQSLERLGLPPLE